MAILLYGAEIWRITAADKNKLDDYYEKKWPNQISNEEQYRHRDGSEISCGETVTPEGKRRQDRPRTTWGEVPRESRKRWDGNHGRPQQRLRETEMGGKHF